MDLLEQDVIEYVAVYTNVPAVKISLETTLLGDLGVDGDDGDEILLGFAKRFQVDMTPIRPVHFGGEGFLLGFEIILWAIQLWRAAGGENSTPESRAGMVPITVQDLINSARAHRWAVDYQRQHSSQPIHPEPFSDPIV